jgi:hypothetical protein
LISGLLLNSGIVDFVVGGCGTGQGYLNSVLQYPGVACGLIQSPLDGWLFQKINGGNCISLALNKGFGWAGNVNLKFIFQKIFEAESGEGYPDSRKESQAISRLTLKEISTKTHFTMADIVKKLDDVVLMPAIKQPGIIDILATSDNHELYDACINRLSKC